MASASHCRIQVRLGFWVMPAIKLAALGLLLLGHAINRFGIRTSVVKEPA